MILSNNAFNWAMLRSGMGTGECMASLTPENEEELFKQYNEWRRKRGLPEEEAIETPPPPEPRKKPTPHAASNNGNVSMVRGALEDDISVLINEVASEMVVEEAEEAELIQNALDGADEIVEEAEAASDEIAKEIEEETVPQDLPEGIETEPKDTADEVDEVAAPEMVTTPAVGADAVPEVDAASEVSTERSMDFAAVMSTGGVGSFRTYCDSGLPSPAPSCGFTGATMKRLSGEIRKVINDKQEKTSRARQAGLVRHNPRSAADGAFVRQCRDTRGHSPSTD